MARYDYKCIDCSHTFEVTHSINEDPRIKCEKCKKPAEDKQDLANGTKYCFRC